MKSVFFLILFASSMAFALPVEIACQLQTGFAKKTKVLQFKALLTETVAHVKFEGRPNSSQRLNPSGEVFQLLRVQSTSRDWLVYDGQFVGDTEQNDREIPHIRSYTLNVSRSALLRPGQRTGSISFSEPSEDPFGSSLYSHSIFCEVVY